MGKTVFKETALRSSLRILPHPEIIIIGLWFDYVLILMNLIMTVVEFEEDVGVSLLMECFNTSINHHKNTSPRRLNLTFIQACSQKVDLFHP